MNYIKMHSADKFLMGALKTVLKIKKNKSDIEQGTLDAIQTSYDYSSRSQISVSVLCFVLLPAAIYCLSYIPFLRCSGLKLTLQNIWECQVSMYNYHKGVNATHSYSSRWWQWLFDIRPILYFLRYPNPPAVTPRAAFGAWLNPVVCWAGLGAVLVIFNTALHRRCNKTGFFILVGYLAQLVPWMFITRITFAYHYFPSMVFLVLALCWVMDRFIDYSPNGILASRALCVVSLTLFAMFYPALTGILIPGSYGDLFLGWFPTWPF
jgi:hypothetical protein